MLNDPMDGDASDGGEGDIEGEAVEYGEAEGGAENRSLTPVFVFISREEFEAHIGPSTRRP